MPSYSFYAHNTIQKLPYAGDIIIFSTIQLDESGVYSNTTGKYIAQTDGIYIFHATLCLEAGKEVDVNFVGGKSVIGFLRPGDFNFLECSTGTATARLQKGDEVYLEVANGDKSSVIEYDVFRNSFSGYLISV